MSNFFRDNLNKSDLVAAPMAGISIPPFRKVLRKFFDGLVYSEMISVEGLSRLGKESVEYLNRYEGERLLVHQLFGGNPSTYSEAIKVIEDTHHIEAYDVNAGCPVRKVMKSSAGSALLEDLPRLRSIMKSIRSSTEKPFSLKIRVGIDDKKLVYNEVLNIAEGEGVNALIIHARTKKDQFSGTVRYDILEEVASRATIPIIGNGSVYDYDSYLKMKSTGVDGVMIARGMMHTPWLFKVIESKGDYSISSDEILLLLLDMYQDMKVEALRRDSEIERLKKINHYKQIFIKFSLWFSRNLRDATTFRKNLYQCKDINEIMDQVDTFYKSA